MSQFKRATILLLCWMGAVASLGRAQEPGREAGEIERTRVSPLLPEGHWAIDALWKAESMGLNDGFLPAQRAIPRYAAGAGLRRAREAAEREVPELAPLTRSWYAVFVQEFPDVADALDAESSAGLRLLGNSVSVGYESWSGRVEPGTAQFPPDRTGPLPLPPLDHPAASGSFAVAAGHRFAFELAPRLRGGELEVRVADVAAGWRAWMVSVGRRPISYGGDGGEGIVLSGGVPLDRMQLETRVPIRFGGILTPLGSSSLHGFFGRLPDERHPGRPFFWGGRAAIQPHRRITLSVQRGAMFGGDGSDKPMTARNLLRMLVGSIAGGAFEDQIVSVTGRYRLPTEAVLPLTVHLEWGAEDGAGALRDVPGRVAGVRAPSLPLVPQMSLGLEYARFGAACCGNPPWYRHYGFPGAWAGVDRPMGHRLGGQGSEVRLHSRAEFARSRARLEADVFRRQRGGDNLFVPGREGHSRGLHFGASWRISPGADLRATLAEERGEGWRERRVEVGGMMFMGGTR